MMKGNTQHDAARYSRVTKALLHNVNGYSMQHRQCMTRVAYNTSHLSHVVP